MTVATPAPETAAASTELAPVSAAKAVLAKDGVTLADVLAAITATRIPATPEPEKAAVAERKLTAPKPLVISEDVRKAVEELLAQAEAIQGELPDKRARLTNDQRLKLGRFYKSARAVKLAADKWIKDTVRPAFFNHFDWEVEHADGYVADSVDADSSGFLLRDDSLPLDGIGTVKRELRPGTAHLDWSVVEKAVAEGRLPKTAVTAMTVPTRSVADHKVVSFFAKNPQYAAVLAEATVTSASTNLNFR